MHDSCGKSYILHRVSWLFSVVSIRGYLRKNKMPKIKTNRSAAKRFYKVTATGKVKRARGGKSHSNEKKGRKRMRRLRSGDYIEGAEAKRVRKVVPYL